MTDLAALAETIRRHEAAQGQPISRLGYFCAPFRPAEGPFSDRVIKVYRGLGDEAALDRYVDNHFQLDLSAKYKLTKNIKLFYEWVNINNAKYYAYNNFGGQRNPYQFEEYSWTMKGGVRVTF